MNKKLYCPFCGEILTEIPRTKQQRRINYYPITKEEYDESIWFVCQNKCFTTDKILIYHGIPTRNEYETIDPKCLSPEINNWSLTCKKNESKNNY